MNITDLGANTRQVAIAGMEKAHRLGLDRERANEEMERAHDTTQKSMAGSGLATGAMIGSSISPGIGTVVGAVIGGAAGYFGADLF